MKHNREAYIDEVEPALNDLADELANLADAMMQFIQVEQWGGMGESDYSYEIAQALAAAEVLVNAIGQWIPNLVPSPRSLHEVLATIAAWRSTPLAARTSETAAKLMEQLLVNSYGSPAHPTAFPPFEDFMDDLRATLEEVHETLT